MYQFNPYHNMLMAHAMQFGGGQGFGGNQMSRFMGQGDMPDFGAMRRSAMMQQQQQGQPWRPMQQPQQPSYGFGNEQRQPMQQPQQQQPPQQMMALPPQFNGGFGGY